MKSLLNAWRRYWFAESPLLDLAIIRVIVVTLQLWLLLPVEPYVSELAELAALPPELYDPLPLLHVLVAPVDWHFRPSFVLLMSVYAATLVSGVFALVGLFTRGSLGLFALGSLFLQAHAYSYGDHHHPEAPIMIALIVLAMSPAGGVLSVDDLRARMRENVDRMRLRGAELLRRRSRFARWPLRTMQWIFGLIYLSAAFYKLDVGGTAWLNGFTMQYKFVQDGLRWGSDLSLWFANQHALAEVFSWVTILFEATFFLVAIFPMLGWIYLPTGAAMHTGIMLTLRAPFMPWVALYAVFVPWAHFFERISGWWRRRAGEPVHVYYDRRCPLCLRSATALDYLDWGDRMRLRDLESAGAALVARTNLDMDDLRRRMHIVRPDGEIRGGYYAFRDLAKRLPLLIPLAPILWLPGIDRLGTRLYDAVARTRARVADCDASGCVLHGSV